VIASFLAIDWSFRLAGQRLIGGIVDSLNGKSKAQEKKLRKKAGRPINHSTI
jgi:hypothetical protein